MIWTGYRLARQDDEQPRQRDNMYNPLHMRRERNRLKKLLERRRNAIEGDREIRRMHTKQPQPQPTQHEILHDADDEEDRKSKELKVPALFRRTSSRRSDRSTSSKYRLSSLNSLCVDFGGRTSSHGVPFICGTSCCGPWVWTVIFILCTVCFIIQTYWTMKEYLQYRTIIEMQLKFEAAPFPAATVCNLNPFKYSQLIQYDDLREGFEHWERVMNARAMTEALKNDANELRKIELEERDREKRSAEKEWIFPIDKHELQKGAVYSPVFVRCTCINQEQCVPNRNPLETNASVCMCFEDVTRGLIWPCYPSTAWTVKKCTKCSISNTCPDPDRPNATKPIGNEQPCLCQGISHHCMIHPKEEIRWWNPNNYTVYPVTEPPKPTDTEEAFGLGELHDAGAITTKTRENIIFLVAALPRDTRRNLSYTLKEFVLRCSFNSQDCDMVRDFELHMDPEYGNCYTFNFNDSVKLKNSRAGPMYGLRLLLDVHQDDYLPTTEAAGVRLVVHEQHQEPFPDTFGYSAPTGFISSFGLKTKVLQRLDYPWGSCSDFFRPNPYIYKEHYSVLKGCYRNCFQMNVIKNCRCGDPRFPLPDQDIRHCEAKSVNDRSCLSRMIDEQSGYHHIEKNVSEKCLCRQPCTENVFETAYSAASWPSANFKLGTACPAVASIVNDTKACTEYYRENTAYIEIYYEQLNFESLKETEGYTMVNLFSDFGGNIGLWIGFSVITIFEYGELLIEVLAYFFYVKPRRKIREIKRQAEERGKPQLPQLLHRYRSQKMADTPQDDDNTQCTRLSDSPSPEKYKHWP